MFAQRFDLEPDDGTTLPPVEYVGYGISDDSLEYVFGDGSYYYTCMGATIDGSYELVCPEWKTEWLSGAAQSSLRRAAAPEK